MSKNGLLKDLNPELIEEWDYEKNKNIDLETLKANSRVSVWWICRIDSRHRWESKVRSRAIDGHGCHYCKGRKVLKEESFAAKHPDLLKQWDYEANSGIDPWSLSEFSNKKIKWRCTANREHTWQSSVASRSRYNSQCPVCSRQNKVHRIVGDKSLVTNFPKIAREWHPTKNGALKASDVTYGSARRVWWQCSRNKSHEWEATVTSRTARNGGKCPVCSGAAVTDSNSLASQYPSIAAEWHPSKNGDLTPDKVKRASGRKVWWLCSKDSSHEWEAVVKNRTHLGSGCPICDAEYKYIRLAQAQFDLSSSGTDYHKVLQSNLLNVNKFIKINNYEGTRLDQPFLRMIYSSVITALETYLSDAFYESVIHDDDRINKLFLTDPEFSGKRFTVEDVLSWQASYKEKASDYLQKIVWHNISRVSHLYKNVLGVKIALDNESIHRAIAIRHDIVHRNGRTKSGKTIALRKADVEELVKNVRAFVSDIDEQMGEVTINLAKLSGGHSR